MFRHQIARSRRTTRTLGLSAVVGLAMAVAGAPAHAAEAPVGLGTAASFAVLAGQSVTNTGTSVVTGDIGVAPGTSVTGIPPLVQQGGALHVADAVANQAQVDLETAYSTAAGRSTVTDVTGQDLGGQTFTSGVVEHTSGMQLTGTVTLDAKGDPSAVFIFKAGSTLVTAPNSTVSLINGASPCNVYWQVGTSTTLDTNTTFAGTVMSLTSATLATGASVQGRVLARNGSVTLDTNVITRPTCTTPASPSPSATATPSPTGTGGGDEAGTGGSGNGGGGELTTDTSQDTPIVPTGHPETGLGGDAPPAGPGWAALLLLGASAVAAAALRWRRSRAVRPS